MRMAVLVLLGGIVGGWPLRGAKPAVAPAKSLDPASIDPAVKPAENFYLYANGNWLKRNPIPPEYGAWGGFVALDARNENVLRAILEEAAADRKAAPGSVRRKVGDFYASGMDEAGIAAAGIQPLASELARIAAIRDAKDLARAVAHLLEIGGGSLFWFGADQDARDSRQVIAQVFQEGLGLPDRDYYLRDDADSGKLRAAYIEHVRRMFVLLGDPPDRAAAGAAIVMALETRLARASMDRVRLRDPEATYHRMKLAAVQGLTPHFPWDEFLAEIKRPDPGDINVAQPKFLAEVDRMFADVPLADWKTYLRWHLIASAAPFLGPDFVAEAFDFEGRQLTGAKEIRPRWKRVMDTIDGAMGEALGQLYVERQFSPAAKARVLAMIENLRAALREKIEGLDWMGAETKREALRKLAAMRVKIGYPDKWRDYSRLEVDRGPYVQNVFRANAFEFQRHLAKIGRPVDRGEWEMTPPTVNAYYSPPLNEIVFPAGILQPPFFDVNAPDAVNYGGIGSVIGHEMTHGFDDEGRQYDAEGNLRNWWTPDDLKNFRARAEAIVEQFNAYPIIDDLKVNGALTTGENIADLGGVKIAEAALRRALEGRPEPAKIDGFDWRQQFFLAFAQIWGTNVRDETKRLHGRTDPHSPPMYRVNGSLSNLPEFGEAFGCPAGSPMVRPAAERVRIW